MQLPQIQKPASWAKLFGMCYTVACILLLPLYLKNGYVDLINGKFKILQALAMIGIVATVGLLFFNKTAALQRLHKSGAYWLVGLCVCYTVVAIFLEN